MSTERAGPVSTMPCPTPRASLSGLFPRPRQILSDIIPKPGGITIQRRRTRYSGCSEVRRYLSHCARDKVPGARSVSEAYTAPLTSSRRRARLKRVAQPVQRPLVPTKPSRKDGVDYFLPLKINGIHQAVVILMRVGYDNWATLAVFLAFHIPWKMNRMTTTFKLLHKRPIS